MAAPAPTHTLANTLFAGVGPMRARCRTQDWARTPLGDLASWPVSLRTAALTVLGSGFPMIMLWGPDLVQIFNDHYLPFLGKKHEDALGQPTRACWPEVWHITAPVYERVLAGETVTLEEAHFPLQRHGQLGPVDDLYITLSYSPLPNDDGGIVGVLATLFDDTAKVLGRAVQAERDLLATRLREALESRAATLEAIVQNIPDALFVARREGVFLANDAARKVLDLPGTAAVTTGLLAAMLPYEALLNDRVTGAPLPLDATPIGRAFNGAPSHGHYLLRARGDNDALRPVRVTAAPILESTGVVTGVVTILTDMTAVHRAEAERDRLLAELDAERTLLRTALEQLPAAVFVVEAPSGRVLALNSAVARIWGGPRPLTEAIENYSGEWIGYHTNGRRIASDEWPVARAARGETITDWTGEIERVDGQRVLIEVSAAPVRNAAGETVAAVAVANDITERASVARERERLLQELDVERARLANVFKHAPTFLAVLRGPEHVFELANEAYYQLVGRRGLVGKPLVEALPEVRAQGFLELINGVLATGDPFIGRELPIILARTPDGEPEARFVDFVYLPLVDADGTRSGIIAHGTDVTEQVEARRQIERLLRESERARADAEAARVEAEAANRGKNEFLAVMSHELRTPLNAIGGYAELIAMGIRGPVTDAQRTDLERIQLSQAHLLALINRVLNYAMLDAGAMPYAPTDVPLDELLTTCEALIIPQAMAKQITLTFSDCDTKLRARADEEKVRQVVLNLLSNALKFTDHGGRVSLSCATVAGEGGNRSQIAVRVSDTGRGIAPDHLERVFQPFVQVDARLTRAQEGTGLGLAISRDLARGMGGELKVESTLGAGSTFTLLLPAA